MTQVIIQDIAPRTQLISSAGQTVFNTNWTADVATDIDVYARADGVEPDDVTQLVNPNQYNVSFVGGSQTVRITFLVGRALDDIITIVRNTPPERLNLYINTNFTPSMLNQDFGILTLIDQQNEMYDRTINPGYNVSATIEPIVDTVLPRLEANQIWVMNSTRTKIITFNVPSGGGFAPSDATYLLQTPNPYLPNAQVMANLNSGFVINTTGTGEQITRIILGVSNQTSVLNGSGIFGNPVIGIANNPVFPGNEGIGLPIGTTLQRPAIPSITSMRFNSDLEFLEYWDGMNWVQLSEVDGVTFLSGTEDQVLVNGTFGIPTDGSITLTLPQDIAQTSSPTFLSVITGSIDSATGNPVMEFVSTPADVNNLQIFSSIAGLPPIIAAEGADPNIDIYISPKGTGSIIGFTRNLTQPLVIYNGTLSQHSTTFQMANTASNRIVTFQDSDGTVAYLTDIPGGSPSALTKVDDTNITISLGGSPANSLLQPVSLTMGWTGLLSGIRGGTGVNNGASTLTLGGSLATIGAFPTSFTMTASTAVTFPTSGTLATVSQIPTGSALTKVDDTNVTLTLGGSPATALVNAASLTLGWSGQLSMSRGGSNASLVAVNGGIVYSTNTSMAISSALTNGQLLIGSTGLSPVVANLTAGPGVSISNGAGSIIISGTGSGTGFTEVTGTSQAMMPDAGYVTNNVGLVTLTLPVTAAFGTTISVIGKGSGGWRIAQNASQSIQVGNQTTATGVGGSLSSTNQYDSIDLVCVTADTKWVVWGAPQSLGLTFV